MSMLSYFILYKDNVYSAANDLTFVVIGFICVILNHLAMQPRIMASIERMIYIYHHRDNFDNTFLPLVVCYMKFIVELSVELLNI